MSKNTKSRHTGFWSGVSSALRNMPLWGSVLTVVLGVILSPVIALLFGGAFLAVVILDSGS